MNRKELLNKVKDKLNEKITYKLCDEILSARFAAGKSLRLPADETN